MQYNKNNSSSKFIEYNEAILQYERFNEELYRGRENNKEYKGYLIDLDEYIEFTKAINFKK